MIKQHLDNGDVDKFLKEMKMIGIELSEKEKKEVDDCFFHPSLLLPHSHIVDKKYDKYLREWAGDYKWQLIFRASENDYSATSFHQNCDNKGPTIIIIKSKEGWIFGGYISKSWRSDSIFYEPYI